MSAIRVLIAHIHKQTADILSRYGGIDREDRDGVGRGNGIRRIRLLGQHTR